MEQRLKTSYRPDIDGLRAIAVLMVIFHHLKLPYMGGGFAGVDMFFVISGYLIGSILINDLCTEGRVRFFPFYARRARRILPALVTVVLVTTLFAFLLLQPEELIHFSRSAFASLLFAANYFFADQPYDYFAAQEQTLPLLHLWSLAVEEQFYLIMPLFLLFLFNVRCMLPGLVIAFLISLFHQGQLGASNEAFFSLPARLWELTTGIIVAWRPARLAKLTAGIVPAWRSGRMMDQAQATLSGLFAMLMLAAGFILAASPTTQFAGVLLVCIATAALIDLGRTQRTMVQQLLSLKPVVAIGLISYSLYLWHWPVLELWKYLQRAPLTQEQMIIYMLLITALATLSWRFIEQPCRHRVPLKRVLLLLAVGMGVVFGAAAFGIHKKGLPERLITPWQPVGVHQFTYFDDMCFLPPYKSFADLGAGCIKKEGTRILLWGDSYAAHYYPGLKAYLKDKDASLSEISMSSCGPLWQFQAPNAANCIELNEKVVALINNERFDMVIIAGNWMSMKGLTIEQQAAKLRGTVDQLHTHAKVFVIDQALAFEYPLTWAGALQTKGHAVLYRLIHGNEPPEPKIAPNFTAMNRMLKEVLAGSTATLIEASRVACDDTSCRYRMENGNFLSVDSGHLTEEGSIYMVEKALGPELDKIIPPR